MGLLAIELNDVGIRAARAGHDHLLPVDGQHAASPGFARLHDNKISTGIAAAQQVSIHPLQVHNRFWDQLDTQPADSRNPHSPNRAEIACAHLQHIVERLGRVDQEVVVAVPPCYDRRQLGIVVAIARDLQLPLEGLVAHPIALHAQLQESKQAAGMMVVDLALHRCVLSVVQAGGDVALTHTRTCPDVGVHAFRRQWLKALGDEFVRHTRFDPLHDGTAQQSLQDQLPELLDALARDGSCPLALESGELVHRVTLTDQLLAHAGHQLMFRLCTDIQELAASFPPAAILLTHEAAQDPRVDTNAPAADRGARS